MFQDGYFSPFIAVSGGEDKTQFAQKMNENELRTNSQ